MKVDRTERRASECQPLYDGDFVKVILAQGTLFHARVVEETKRYLRVVLHSLEPSGNMTRLEAQPDGKCLGIDTLLPWSNVAIVMHCDSAPQRCKCVEA